MTKIMHRYDLRHATAFCTIRPSKKDICILYMSYAIF